MKKAIYSFCFFAFALCWSGYSAGQSAGAELSQLMQDDSADIQTLALYPQQMRENIFKVSTHPEGITRIEDAQKKSQESFKNLIAAYPKEEQQKIWNLTRYDNLLSELAATKGKKKRVEEVLKKFPAEIHDDALTYATEHKVLVVSLDKMNQDFNSSFQAIVAGYEQRDQDAFREMMKAPEAFSLLSRNMHMTVHLGAIYKSDAALVSKQFDSLSLVLAEQKAREAQEWKQEMKSNPEAAKEMEQSAKEYATSQGMADAEADPKIVERYVFIPYPYWAGYPWWYEAEYWYPYPYWYHSGFYHWHGEIFWLYPPSWYFVHWHFHHHHHFYHYPHITNVYINHYYYGPRRGGSRNAAEVRDWMRKNESTLPRDFRTSNEMRIDRIRELGKAEMDLESYHKNNPGKTVTRDEFIRQHADQYPHLKQPAAIEQPVPRKPDISPADAKPAEQPVKTQPKTRTDRSEPKQPVIIKEPPVKSQPKAPAPKPKEEQPRSPRVVPKQAPASPTVPAQPKQDKEVPRKRNAD